MTLTCLWEISFQVMQARSSVSVVLINYTLVLESTPRVYPLLTMVIALSLNCGCPNSFVGKDAPWTALVIGSPSSWLPWRLQYSTMAEYWASSYRTEKRGCSQLLESFFLVLWALSLLLVALAQRSLFGQCTENNTCNHCLPCGDLAHSHDTCSL